MTKNYTSPLPADLVPTMRDPNTPIVQLPDVPIVRRPAWCPRCGKDSPVMGVPCDACRPAHVRQTREGLLAPASNTIPGLFAWARFGAPELAERVSIQTAIEEARAALEAPRVVLIGRAGCGKTSLAVALARAVLDAAIEPGCSVEAWRRAQGLRFVPAYDLARANAQHGLGEGQPPIVLSALGASLLVLDDLGAEPPKLLNSPVPDVIYQRHARPELQTVVTTGFSEEAIAERYGDGIARRLFEGAVVVYVSGAAELSNSDLFTWLAGSLFVIHTISASALRGAQSCRSKSNRWSSRRSRPSWRSSP